MELVSLEKYKQDNSDNAADWSVVDALKRAIELCETGEFEADRVIICLARTTDEDEMYRYRVMRIGSHLEALGLLTQTTHDLLVSAGDPDDTE